MSMSVCITGMSCSDEPEKDEPEQTDPTPDPTPDPDPDPEPTPDPAPSTDSIGDYFKASLEGKTLPSLGGASPITQDEYDAVKAELWNKWKDVNKSLSEDRLPSPVSLDNVNFDNPSPTATWSLPDGRMSVLYGYKGSRPDGGYPLFIGLHGSGNDAHYEWSVSADWFDYFSDAPSIYFIPKSPQGGTKCRWYQPSRQQAWERVIRQAYLADDVNPDKIYFMGISEGAYGTERLASFYADYLAGAGPIAGGEPLYSHPAENTANIAYCQQTGENDTMYGRSRVVRNAMSEWKRLEEEHPGYYVHKIDLQPGKGHGCDYTKTTPWLKKYSRNPWPKYVYWENFGLGNVNGESYACREGFYNLRAIKGQYGKTDGELRDAYEMTIDGNNIDLKVYGVSRKADQWVESKEEGWSMNVGAKVTREPATKGTVRIYLNKELVDLSKPVTVTVNGAKKFEGTVTLDRRTMIESLALYFDPARIFPASIDVTVE